MTIIWEIENGISNTTNGNIYAMWNIKIDRMCR